MTGLYAVDLLLSSTIGHTHREKLGFEALGKHSCRFEWRNGLMNLSNVCLGAIVVLDADADLGHCPNRSLR